MELNKTWSWHSKSTIIIRSFERVCLNCTSRCIIICWIRVTGHVCYRQISFIVQLDSTQPLNIFHSWSGCKSRWISRIEWKWLRNRWYTLWLRLVSRYSKYGYRRRKITHRDTYSNCRVDTVCINMECRTQSDEESIAGCVCVSSVCFTSVSTKYIEYVCVCVCVYFPFYIVI